MESRIQILDRLARKWSRINPDCIAVDTFDEWLKVYDSEATIRLVYIAMQEYSNPVKNNVAVSDDIECEDSIIKAYKWISSLPVKGDSIVGLRNEKFKANNDWLDINEVVKYYVKHVLLTHE